MEPYGNFSGDSGVHSFEIGPDFITVRFHDRPPYLYTYETAGRDNVERMKRLPEQAEDSVHSSANIARYTRATSGDGDVTPLACPSSRAQGPSL
jgi:hypothetical protein